MKTRLQFLKIVFALVFACGVLFTAGDRPAAQRLPDPGVKSPQSMPEVIVLAKGSKAGQVTFNHLKHNGGEYNRGGPVACIECHHTAQPAAELVRSPPLKTAWPAGRTTTLTTELFAADPKAAGVASCRSCHVPTGKKPKLLPAIPTLKDPETGKVTRLTSEIAFHQRCDTCHYQITFQSPGSKAPSVTNCSTCHKK